METTMSNMIGGLTQAKMSSNDKMEKATVSAREMEKHMTTALMWMAEAITDRCKETDKVEEENKKLREQMIQNKEMMGRIWIATLIVWVFSLGTSMYVCS
jgi:ABC-type bacteriocin/lantibiotic exporter with double-glycine peptidase domain